VPSPEPDAGFEIPTLEESHVVSSLVRPGRRVWPWIAAGFAAIAALAIGALVWSEYARSDPPAAPLPVASSIIEPPREVAAAPEPPGVEAPRPEAAVVAITLESVPPGAEVLVDSEARGRTPITLELPRAETPVAIELRARGHVALEETIVPNVDQRLRLTLERRRQRATKTAGMTERGFRPWQ
jgi:hypothetical protein